MITGHPLAPQSARAVVLTGVAGCGKSTVGAALASRLGKPFLDADDYHPQANISKMARGIALSDADRWPWLDSLGEALRDNAREHGATVSACSALKRAYRDRLVAVAGEPILFVYLHGSRDLIGRRMAARTDHFMPSVLLDSQFATLEVPTPEENAVTVDIGPTAAELAESLYQWLARTHVAGPEPDR